MPLSSITAQLGEIREIAPNQVRLDKDACLYPMSFAYDLEPLKASIREVGIVNPPILRFANGESSGLQIITGLKRVVAAQEMGLEKMVCRILSPSQISRKQALLLAFYENLACRQFNTVEKALILTHLSEHFRTEDIINNFMVPLGLPRRQQTYELYMEIERKLPLNAKKALARDKLNLKAAALLLTIEPEDIEILVNYGLRLKFNVNQFYEFIDIMIDLASKHEKPIDSILKSKDILSIIDNPIDNMPQKANKVLQVLRRIRYPVVTQTEERLRQRIRALTLPKGARFILPRFLEDSEYKLEIRFKNATVLKESIRKTWEACKSLSLEAPLLEALNLGSKSEGHEI